MTQPNQTGPYYDQTQPANQYGQQNSYQGYQQPPTDYQYQGYQQPTPGYPPQNYYQPQYQPPVAPPPKKGFPGWAWGLIGLAAVAIIAVVVVAILVTSNKTTKTDPTATTNPTSVATTAAATTAVNSATTTVAAGTTAGATTTAAVTTKPATTAATTTKPATTTAVAVPTPALEDGWTNFKPNNAGFSIALPSDWQSVDQDSVKTFLDEGLKQLQDKNPQFSSSLANQVKAVFASGVIKFFGFDTTSSSDFTVNLSVGKQAVPASTTLDSYVQLNLSQIENAVKLSNPAEQKKVTLAGVEAVQLKYEWSITVPATGEPADITTIQYMIVSNKNAYIVTFTCLSDQIDEKLPLFEQIMDTFRVA
jgi:hypothetical protein